MLYLEWKKYFETVETGKLQKLEDALKTILEDEAIAREFKDIGLLDLRYLAGNEVDQRKEKGRSN